MRAPALLVLALLLASCSTPQSRIKKHRAEFDSYPPEVQRRIRDGQVDPGFTFDQVEMALGTPDRTYTRTTADKEEEIWVYGPAGSARPHFGFGVGVASGGPTVIGTGVGVSSGPYERGERIHVVFEGGRVVSIRRRDR